MAGDMLRRWTGRVQGRAAAWVEAGAPDAPPLLVLHGAGLDRGGCSFGPAIPGLAEHFRVLAPDLPGHGDTQILPEGRGLPGLARWAAAFLDHMGIDRLPVTGVSMGGAVSILMALDHRPRVMGIVPCATYGIARRAPMLHPLFHAVTRLPLNRMADPLIANSNIAAWSALRAIVHDPSVITPEIVAELRRVAAETPAEDFFDSFFRSEVTPTGFRTALLPRLGSLKVPALFIHGLHDGAVPVAAGREAARAAGVDLVELDAGHWPMFEDPDGYLAAALPFLETVQNTKSSA